MYRLLLAEMNSFDRGSVSELSNGVRFGSAPQIDHKDCTSNDAARLQSTRSSGEDENVQLEHRRRSSQHTSIPIIMTPVETNVNGIAEMNGKIKPIAQAKGPIATMKRISRERSGASQDYSQGEEAAYDDAFYELQRLTVSQREIVKRTFPLMEENAIRNALEILVRLFSEYPHYKNIWPQFRAIPDSSLMSAVELRRHASVYMQGLRAIIDAMDDEKLLSEQLKRIARAHIKWNIHKAHVMHMLQPVLAVLAQTLKMPVLDEATETAWTTLYDVIANLIDIFRAVERRASLSRSSVS